MARPRERSPAASQQSSRRHIFCCLSNGFLRAFNGNTCVCVPASSRKKKSEFFQNNQRANFWRRSYTSLFLAGGRALLLVATYSHISASWWNLNTCHTRTTVCQRRGTTNLPTSLSFSCYAKLTYWSVYSFLFKRLFSLKCMCDCVCVFCHFFSFFLGLHVT